MKLSGSGILNSRLEEPVEVKTRSRRLKLGLLYFESEREIARLEKEITLLGYK